MNKDREQLDTINADSTVATGVRSPVTSIGTLAADFNGSLRNKNLERRACPELAEGRPRLRPMDSGALFLVAGCRKNKGTLQDILAAFQRGRRTDEGYCTRL